MKLSQGTGNFWSQITNYILSSAVTIALAFFFYGWPLCSIVTVFLFLCFIWLLSDIKKKLLRVLPDNFEYQLAVLEDYPLLNLTWLDQQTRELEELGFVKLIDYKTGNSPAFGRCFAHFQNYCYAEINEVFTPTGESFARNIVINSSLDQGWTLGTINRPPNNTDSLSYGLWPNPKSVRTYHPSISLENLLQKHLQMRQRMINDIGVILLTDISWENYVQKQQEGVIYRKKALKESCLLLGMMKVRQFELNPKSEWLGDYANFLNRN